MTSELQTTIEQLKLQAAKETVGVDILKYLYNMYKAKGITDDEALELDITDILYYYFQDKCQNREIIRALIRGEIRTGKSTAAIKIKKVINHIIYNLKRRNDEADEYKTICSDQTEFIRLIKSDLKNVCIQIDEYNTMAEGGANASTEAQVLQSYGDMFGIDGVHVISVNPTHLTDTNAFIHLEVIGKKPGPNGYIRLKLLYVNNIENDRQVLGHVNIYVWDLIQNWEENVSQIFYKQNKNKNDETYLENQKKQDYYVRYIIKKENRLKLLKSEGIRDIRELEFSTVVMETYKELQELATIQRVPPEIIIATIKDACRKEQRIYSMYAELDVMTKVKSILSLVTALSQTNKKLKKAKNDEERRELKTAYNKYKELFTKRLHEELRLSETYKKYLEIQ